MGARADVLEFFLTHKKGDFAVADVAEIGYTKRNVADVLDGFFDAGIFEKRQVRNQQRYSFVKRDQMQKIVGPLPEFTPRWSTILGVLLSLRACIHNNINKS